MAKSLLAVVFFGIIGTALAFPDNVPATGTTCREMIPGHGHSPQTSPSPYQVTTSDAGIKSGEQLDVTIKGSGFKGFFLQARDSKGNPVGTFKKTGHSGTNNCFGKPSNSAHHNSNTLKTSVKVTWTAPKDFKGKVTFTATVLQDFFTFWTQVKSKPVEVKLSSEQSENLASGKVAFTDEDNSSKPMRRGKVLERRGRIMTRKPVSDSSNNKDWDSFKSPASAANYQVQVTHPSKASNNYSPTQPARNPSHNHKQAHHVPLTSSYSVSNPKKPLRNRLSNVGTDLHVFDDDPYTFENPSQFDIKRLPERKVNYQIKIKPSPSIHSTEDPISSNKQITSTAFNTFVSHFPPPTLESFRHPDLGSLRNPDLISFRNPDLSSFRNPDLSPFHNPDLSPFHNPDLSSFRNPNLLSFRNPELQSFQNPGFGSKFVPPKPIFGFRPNYYPLPLENSFHHRRGTIQRSGSFQFPPLQPTFPVYEDVGRQGVHLPTYGYLIFNSKRGPPYYIIPEFPYEYNPDNEFHPTQNKIHNRVIKPRKIL